MKPRSPRFPFLPLEEAIDLLRKLDAFSNDRETPLKQPQMLKALDYASFHGAAVKTIGALRAYDLLIKNGDGLSISPVGAKILDANSDDERREFLQRAALSPLTFRMIWRNARHLSRPELKDLLLGRGFTEPGARRASKIYRRNDEFAGLQTLELEPELPPRGEGRQAMIQRKQAARKMARAGRGPAARPCTDMLRLPLGGRVAVIPKGMKEEEYALLMQTLRAWKEQLVA
jgi:hypothetical protein